MTDVVLCTNKSPSPRSIDSLGWGLYLIEYREYESLTSGDITSPLSPHAKEGMDRLPPSGVCRVSLYMIETSGCCSHVLFGDGRVIGGRS